MAQQLKQTRIPGKSKYQANLRRRAIEQGKGEKDQYTQPAKAPSIVTGGEEQRIDVSGMRSCITLPFCINENGDLSLIALTSKEVTSAPWLFPHHRNSYTKSPYISEFVGHYMDNNSHAWGIHPPFTLVACGPLPTQSPINHDRDYAPVAWALMVCNGNMQITIEKSWRINGRLYSPEVLPFNERTIERISVDQRPLLTLMKSTLEHTFPYHKEMIGRVVGRVIGPIKT